MEEIIKKCIQEHLSLKSTYDKIYDYFIGESDVYKNYKQLSNRSNRKMKLNYIKKFVKDETSYILSNPLEYQSISGNQELINTIDTNLAHWSKKHDRKLGQESILYGLCYEVYFTDSDGRFSSLIVSPRNGYLYKDEYGIKQFFLYIFKKKFDETQYVDIYYPNKVVNCRMDSSGELVKLKESRHIFNEVPVAECLLSDSGYYDTLFNDIKDLQDNMQTNLADLSNELSDWRNAILKLKNCKIKDEDIPAVNDQGVLELPKENSEAEWLLKKIDASFGDLVMKMTKENLYELANHVDGQAKLTSNTSSLTLRQKLFNLESKCKYNMAAITDAVRERIKFLFKYIKFKTGKEYNYLDSNVKFTPAIPQDDLLMAQIFSQLQNLELFSKDTMRSQFSFVTSSEGEKKKLEKESVGITIGEALLNSGDDDESIKE